MVSEQEKKFILYWEAQRIRQKTFLAKIIRGLPMAMLFSFPILLFVFAVNIFFPEWSTRISNMSFGTMGAIMTGIFLCILFFAYFRMHYLWETNEQLYKELKSKEKKENNL